MGPGVGSEGVAVGVCPLPSLCCVRLPAQLSAVTGVWSFCILLFIMCPNCTCSQLLLVPNSFFVLCCGVRPRIQAFVPRRKNHATQ